MVDDPAPKGGTVVKAKFVNSGAIYITVPEGQTSGSSSVLWEPVSTPTSFQMTAILNGVESPPSTVTVVPPSASTISFSPASVVGGNSVTGTVTLNGTGAPPNTTVSLATNNADFSIFGAA